MFPNLQYQAMSHILVDLIKIINCFNHIDYGNNYRNDNNNGYDNNNINNQAIVTLILIVIISFIYNLYTMR